jgi:hypothetical protein
MVIKPMTEIISKAYKDAQTTMMAVQMLTLLAEYAL